MAVRTQVPVNIRSCHVEHPESTLLDSSTHFSLSSPASSSTPPVTMHPSNILVALAPFLGLTQAAALHSKSHITVELYGDYGKHYVEKVWPDGDEHWFSKSFTSVLQYSPLLSPMFPINLHRADGFTQQTRARTSGRRTSTSSSSSTTRRRRTVRSVVSQLSPTTPGTR